MPTILVVDDNKMLADSLALVLRSNAYNVTVAYNGRHGYELARLRRPDLIISDVVMPEMDGVEMAIKIHQEFAETKILLVSGQASTLDLLKRARDKGYEFDALAKPVHPVELLAKVKELVVKGASQPARICAPSVPSIAGKQIDTTVP